MSVEPMKGAVNGLVEDEVDMDYGIKKAFKPEDGDEQETDRSVHRACVIPGPDEMESPGGGFFQVPLSEEVPQWWLDSLPEAWRARVDSRVDLTGVLNIWTLSASTGLPTWQLRERLARALVSRRGVGDLGDEG